jgi:hypothetical protein
MSGLGTVQEGGATFLSIAGGYIWDRKADESDVNFATQKFVRANGEEDQRQGARYSDLTGTIVGAQFRTHEQYGENINVTVDASGDRYILSISTNNRNSQDIMKMMLKADLSKPVYIKPYDFIGTDKKRAQGISFKQDGQKIDLRNDDAPQAAEGLFKSGDKKKVKRYFEDLTEWYVAEIEESVIPKFKPLSELPKKEVAKVKEKEEIVQSDEDEDADFSESIEKPVKAKVIEKEEFKEVLGATPLKMKRELKNYISENYEGKSLPDLSKEDLVTWYNLSQNEEELPFGSANAEVEKTDIDSQLDALMGN